MQSPLNNEWINVFVILIGLCGSYNNMGVTKLKIMYGYIIFRLIERLLY